MIRHHNWNVDLAALGTVGASMAGWLPTLALLFPVIYYGMMMTTWVVNRGWKRKE